MADNAYEDATSQLWEVEGLFARDVDGQLIRVVSATEKDYAKDVTLTIDGQTVTVKKAVPTTDSQGNVVIDQDGKTIPRSTTIYDAAAKLFVKKPGDVNPIPVLCHQEHMNPAGVCRICVVEVFRTTGGKRRSGGKLLPSCAHRAEPDMEVHTLASTNEEARQRVQRSVRVLTELLASDHLRPKADGAPARDKDTQNELELLVERVGANPTRFASRNPVDRGRDNSSTLIAVDHNSCILCNRCIRACDEIKKNFVVGRAGKGYTAKIAFDLDDPMEESSCVSCGECMVSCPTDALTFRKPVVSDWWKELVEKPEYTAVSPQELKKMSLFAGVSYKFLQWNSASVVRRKTKKGDVLCRQGDYGATAFILNEGEFGVYIGTPRKSADDGPVGFFGKLFGRGTKRTNDDSTDYGTQVSTRTPEHLILGEMTCMSDHPRTATVVAMGDGEVLEIRRNVLYVLQRNPAARAMLDRVYRERALQDHLRTISFFQDLTKEERHECVEFLRDKVSLLRVDPGQNIFRQGEAVIQNDEFVGHFYMIRLGYVKVTQTLHGTERVLDYIGPNRHFGEIALLSKIPNLIDQHVPESLVARRTATCTALDDVELVRIRGEHFSELILRFEKLRNKFIQICKTHLDQNRPVNREMGLPMAGFLDQGLFNAQTLLVMDLESCTRCDECTRACSDTHGGIVRLIREGQRIDKFLVASSCRSCQDPYCLVGCPVDSIHRKGSLEIVIDDHCIGCGQCAKNCPYGNINMHGFDVLREYPPDSGCQRPVVQQKATTCDLCRQVVGPHSEVSCVYSCPHNAAFRMSGSELLKIVSGKAELQADRSTRHLLSHPF